MARKAHPIMAGWAVAALIVLPGAVPRAENAAPAAVERPAPAGFEPRAPESIGVGDGRIWMIPSLSAPSVKDGGKLTIQTVIKAPAGVVSARAEIMDGDRVLDALELKSGDAREGGVGWLGADAGGRAGSAGLGAGPSGPGVSGPSAPGTAAALGLPELGVWSADWTARGLEEKFYNVRLTVTDGAGHAFADASLKFSDPIAGNATPGTTGYPNGGMRLAGTLTGYNELSLRCAVIDAIHGFAYFGTDTSPGSVVKVALGGDGAPIRVGALILNSGEDRLFAAVIDPMAGYAYFGTLNSRIVKVALGEPMPTRVGAVTATGNFRSAVIDPGAGYAYFGTSSSPGKIVKIALGGAGPPALVGTLTLEPGEDYFYSAVIDPAAGYAYFGTGGTPPSVVKVALGGDGAPTRVGVLALNANQGDLISAAIDPAAGYAYFGASGVAIKVALGGTGPPTLVGSVTIPGIFPFMSAAIDPAGGVVYFGDGTWSVSAGTVVKLALGGTGPPTLIGTLTLEPAEKFLESALIDPAAGRLYFGTSAGAVVTAAFGAADAAPTRVGAIKLYVEEDFRCAVIDIAAGCAYFGTNGFPGRVVKVLLGGAGAPIHAGELALDAGENNLASAVIDPAAGHAYFGTATSPGIVVKVALGGEGPPTRLGSIMLDAGENQLISAAIDTAAGYAYFGTITSPGIVVKVGLGGAGPPTRVGALTLESGEDRLRSAAIDPAAGHAYFGTAGSNVPGRVVKVALGGMGAPTRVGAVALEDGENELRSAAIDPAAGYGYFGTATGRAVKIALGGEGAPTRVGAVAYNTPPLFSPSHFYSAAIDPAAGRVYFGASYGLGVMVMKVALGGAGPPIQDSYISVSGTDSPELDSAVIDPASGYAYFGTDDRPGRILKFQLSYKGFFKTSKIVLPEPGAVTSVQFYSHEARGQVRLALYDNLEPRNLLWEAGPLTNTAANDWLIAPISSGSPGVLFLPAGMYQLAWQVDTNASVASLTAGISGDGFTLDRPFGPVPAALNPLHPEATNEKWSLFVSYATVREALLGFAPMNAGLDLNGDGAVDISDLMVERYIRL